MYIDLCTGCTEYKVSYVLHILIVPLGCIV